MMRNLNNSARFYRSQQDSVPYRILKEYEELDKYINNNKIPSDKGLGILMRTEDKTNVVTKTKTIMRILAI